MSGGDEGVWTQAQSEARAGSREEEGVGERVLRLEKIQVLRVLTGAAEQKAAQDEMRRGHFDSEQGATLSMTLGMEHARRSRWCAGTLADSLQGQRARTAERGKISRGRREGARADTPSRARFPRRKEGSQGSGGS
eukprot:1485175-Rhodomonas_salina.1